MRDEIIDGPERFAAVPNPLTRTDLLPPVFLKTYRPLITHWLRRLGPGGDAMLDVPLIATPANPLRIGLERRGVTQREVNLLDAQAREAGAPFVTLSYDKVQGVVSAASPADLAALNAWETQHNPGWSPPSLPDPDPPWQWTANTRAVYKRPFVQRRTRRDI